MIDEVRVRRLLGEEALQLLRENQDARRVFELYVRVVGVYNAYLIASDPKIRERVLRHG